MCFLGYPFNVKGYKVFDLSSHSVFISRDVTFHESIFPYKTSISNSTPPIESSVPLPCTSSLPFDDIISPSSHSAIPTFVSSNLEDTILQIHHELDDDFLHDVSVEPPKPCNDPIPIRQSTRAHKRPSYLQDYYCNMVVSSPTASVLQSSTSHPLSSYLSYHSLSSSYKTICCSISSIVKPTHYYQAVTDPKWQDEMAAEIAAPEANNTWT